MSRQLTKLKPYLHNTTTPQNNTIMSDQTNSPQTPMQADHDTNEAIEAMLRKAMGVPKPAAPEDSNPPPAA